jgi:hypothetical protein
VAGVSIHNESIICQNLSPETTYNRLSYCPILKPAPGAKPSLFVDPGAPEPLRVATNVPSMLLRQRGWLGRIHELAYLPRNCFFEDGSAWKKAPEQPLFAVGGDLGQGRVLVLADHSIFINQMMLPNDNKNVEFAINCITWLAGERRQRNRVLLVEDGQIRTDLEVPLKPPVIRPEDALQAIVSRRNELLFEGERALGKMEDEDFFNNKLLEALDDWRLTPLRQVQIALGVLTVLLLIYAIYRLGVRARHRQESGVPAVAAAVGARLPAGTLVEQRQREMLRAGNLAEPARQLVRDWFEQTGGAGAQAPPRVRVQGSWWLRWKRAWQVSRLWKVARGRTGRVTPGRLRSLLALLTELAAAHSEGRMQLEWGAGSAGASPSQSRLSQSDWASFRGAKGDNRKGVG